MRDAPSCRCGTDTLTRLAAGRSNLKWLDDAVQAGVVRVGEPGIRFFTPDDGEAWLRNTFGGNPQIYKETSDGPRFLDLLSGTSAHESKVGRMSARASYKRQIAKDKELLINDPDVNAVTWHFFPSDITSKVGPTPALVDALRNPPPPLEYVIHLPA